MNLLEIERRYLEIAAAREAWRIDISQLETLIQTGHAEESALRLEEHKIKHPTTEAN